MECSKRKYISTHATRQCNLGPYNYLLGFGRCEMNICTRNVHGPTCLVLQVVFDRIARLDSVNEAHDNWRNVIDGGDENNTCTAADIFAIRQRSIYLSVALKTFVKQVPNLERWTWQKCTEDAIEN